MADPIDPTTVPADLVGHRRRFEQLDQEIAAFGKTLPSGREIRAGAEISDEQRARMQDLRDARMREVLAINGHSWLVGSPHRFQATLALRAAARADAS